MKIELPNGRGLSIDRPRIMGILNVTPDSFSDGGRHDQVDAAVAHAMQMIAEGADIIDVGGESTRPGAAKVSTDEQIARTKPVIAQIAKHLKSQETDRSIVISIDTMSAAVAGAAIEAGAEIINDVSAGTVDSDMFNVAAKLDVAIVLMHMLGTPQTMQENPNYDDAVAEIRQYLIDRASKAEAAGVAPSQIMIDPGIGFGKTKRHNLELLAHLNQFVKTGYPVLLGTSRKRFMGAICSDHEGNAPLPAELVGATCATTALGVAQGVMLFRVHDVKANRQAADVAWALQTTQRDDTPAAS